MPLKSVEKAKTPKMSVNAKKKNGGRLEGA
jgi:hypothetical protein